MPRSFFKFSDLWILLLSSAVILSCGPGPVELADGSSSETVVGRVLLPGGGPAAGAEVRLIPENYNPVEGEALPAAYLETTDTHGRFAFQAGEGKVFNLEARDLNETNRLIHRGVAPQAGSKVDLEDLSLALPGSVTLTVPPGQISAGDYVYIPGTTRFVILDSGKGLITLDDVPADVIPEIRLGRAAAGEDLVLGNSVVLASDAALSLPSRHILLLLPDTIPDTSEQLAVDRLIGMELHVVIVRDQDFVPGDLTGMAMLMIPQTAFSAFIGPEFRDFAIPIVVADPPTYATLQMTGPVDSTDFGRWFNRRDLEILMPAHPIAAGFTGTVRVSDTGHQFKWGIPASADIIAVDVLEPGKPLIFAYGTGDLLYDGAPAPARRVGMFNSLGESGSLNENGWKLFEASVRWAMGEM